MVSSYTKKLLRDLNEHRSAVIVLVILIAVGISLFVAMRSVYRDLDGARKHYYDAYRIAHFTVDIKRAPHWVVDEVAQLPNVRSARGRIATSTLLNLHDEDAEHSLTEASIPIPGLVLSMPIERTPVENDLRLVRGSWFTDDGRDQVIVNDAFAKAHHLLPGSRLLAQLQDQRHNLLVVGIASSPEFVYLIPPGGGIAPDPSRYGILYLTEQQLRETEDLEGAYNQIIGRAHHVEPARLDDTLRTIDRMLQPYGVVDTTPFQRQVSVSFLNDELMGIEVSSRTLPLIFLGVAVLILNIFMGRLVAKERVTIGTLRALGYSSRRVMGHYLWLGAMVGVIGGACGSVAAVFIERALVTVYRRFYAIPHIDARLHPDLMLLGVGIAVFFAVLGAVTAARRAAALQPADAMRPATPRSGRRVAMERFFPNVWSRLTSDARMALRSISRQRFRTGVSLFAAIVSTALILATLSLARSIHRIMDHEFRQVMHQGVTLALRNPVDDGAAREMESVDGFTYVEPELNVMCDITHGPYERRVGVSGLGTPNRLNTPLDRHDQPITIPNRGLVMSQKLAELLHVRAGEQVSLRALVGERRTVDATVASITETFLGLSVYADLHYLSRLIGEERVTNTILAATVRPTVSPAGLRSIGERPGVVGYSLRSWVLRSVNETFGKTLNTALGVLVFFSGLIAFGAIVTTAVVSVGERQREIGTLRVIGYSARRVAAIFARESLLANGLGVVIGLGAGVILAKLLARAYDTELYRFPATIGGGDYVLTLLSMALVVTTAQIVLVALVVRVDWLESMKIKE